MKRFFPFGVVVNVEESEEKIDKNLEHSHWPQKVTEYTFKYLEVLVSLY